MMTDVVNIDDSSTTLVNLEPLGEVLLAARVAKKLTQKDVSNSLRFSINQINAIENNDFSALPQPMITRGFIRNYARLLEIDAEPLLTSYRMRVPEKTHNPVSVQSATYQVMSSKESLPWLNYLLGSIFIVLFLLAWILYIDYMPKSAKAGANMVAESNTINQLPVQEASLVATAPSLTMDEASIISSTTPQSANDELIKTVDLPAGQAKNVNENNKLELKNPPVTTQQLSSNPTVITSAQVVAPAVIAQSLAPAISNTVNMSFDAATWVQVTDKSGKIIFEKILVAGASDGFNGEKPFNVVIGNAKATKLSFLGKAVDLAPYTTENNVARLKLE